MCHIWTRKWDLINWTIQNSGKIKQMPIEYLSLRYFIKCKNCISFTTVQKKELVLNWYSICFQFLPKFRNFFKCMFKIETLTIFALYLNKKVTSYQLSVADFKKNSANVIWMFVLKIFHFYWNTIFFKYRQKYDIVWNW